MSMKLPINEILLISIAGDEGTGPSNGKANGKAEMSAEEREKKEKNSIPLQLQRLFARLQMCDTQSVKTKVSFT